ncbi:MAG TPA: hypothetical protein VF899_10725 [Pyrinomonadaceae bacterium]
MKSNFEEALGRNVGYFFMRNPFKLGRRRCRFSGARGTGSLSWSTNTEPGATATGCHLRYTYVSLAEDRDKHHASC